MDINKALRSAVSTGKVHFGADQARKAIKKKEVKLLIVAGNFPAKEVEGILQGAEVPLYNYSGTNNELGASCGKPFPISVLSILAEGDSGILALGK